MADLRWDAMMPINIVSVDLVSFARESIIFLYGIIFS